MVILTMENFKESLKKTGLTSNESEVYLQLLKNTELSANELANKIGMDRALTYTVLNQLIKKGLVNHVIKSNRKSFKAKDPSNLLNSIKEKEAFVNGLVPRLKTIEKLEESKQEVNIYEGRGGLRSIINLLMKQKCLCSFGVTGKAYDIFYEFPALAKEWEKRNFTARIITHSKNKNHPMTKLKGVEPRYLDVNSEATTTIFGDYVSVHITKERPLVILIKNKEIADTYRNHFEVLWKTAKRKLD